MSTSRKSGSGSKLRLRKVLARKTSTFKDLEMSHLPYLWAAYRRGTLPVLKKGLTQDGFKDAMLGIFNQVSEAYVLLAETEKGQIPVGVGVVKAENARAWPHIWWFPEATPRVKLEIVARYIVELRKRFLLLIICEHIDKPFFNKVSSLGLTKRVGTIDGWNDDPVALYQSRVAK